MAFKKGDIQKRMEASAISVRRQSVEGLLATGMIGVILWLIGFLGVTFMYGSRFWQSGLCVYYILNTFTMLIVALSLSYLDVYKRQLQNLWWEFDSLIPCCKRDMK